MVRALQFPGYLKDNVSTLSAEDKTRYEAQSKVVAQIVATFEDPSFKDDDPQKSLKIVELMQEVRSRFKIFKSTLLLNFRFPNRCKSMGRHHRRLWVPCPLGSTLGQMVYPNCQMGAPLHNAFQSFW